MRPTRAILATAVAVVAAAVAVLATLALVGDVRGNRDGYTHLQANLCGNACNSGGLSVVSTIVDSIRRREPYSVTLNEICENQYDKLRADLPGYQGGFDPTGPSCRNGARYGNAILARSDLNPVGSWELPNPARDELRRLMCLSTRPVDGGPVTVCVTHISNESGNIAAQVDAVASILSGLQVDGGMLIGGDFNTNPADQRMDPMYRAYQEADMGGGNRGANNVTDADDVLNEDTYGPHKYDYIFLSRGHWSLAEADAVAAANGFSDHDELWATIAVR